MASEYYIHINMHHIRHNRKPENKYDQIPPITIKQGKHRKVDEAFEIDILGDSKLVYDPFEPILSCGARLVLICDDYEKVK